MKPATGATPLSSLHAVALDTETTGLDPNTARIVQIGLVRLFGGAEKPDTRWEQLINPGLPISEESSKVHGVDDHAVADAPDLRNVWPQFIERIGSSVIIGHTIGFDLAVLEAEAARHRVKWKPPRALCVRMLAMLVAPSLADHSLDALAGWLGTPIADRHRALGDALSAGAVFTALLPMLKQIDIETLAQAERACRRLTPEVVRHESAGWTLPAGQASGRPVTAGRLDSSAYRHAVGEIMASPPIVMKNTATLAQAMDEMTRKGSSSVFTADTAEPELPVDQYGIVTERDIMRRLSAERSAAFDLLIGDIASRPIASVRQDAFIYRAAGRMSRMKFRHLGVRDELDRLVGAVSARDLLRARTSPAILLDDTIDLAASPQELAAAWSTLPAVASDLLDDTVDAPIICRIISEEIRAITRRAAILAHADMEAHGHGPAPCAFAVMVLGSGGRGESMLVPDQDNAIVFESGDPKSPTDDWFALLGEKMSQTLDAAGIPFCKGGIMAMNEAWRGSLATWKHRVDDWVSRSKPKDLLNVDIFFDAYPVHGERRLARDLMAYAYGRGHENVTFAKAMGEAVGTQSSPFTLFGGIRTEGNALDMKMHVLFPITATARALAVRHNLAKQSTRERLESLHEAGIANESDVQSFLAAQELAFELVLENQSRDIEAGLKPGNTVDLSKLDRERHGRLKSALRHVESAPVLVRDLMFAKP